MPETERYPIVLAHGITRPDYLIDYIARRFNLMAWWERLFSDKLHYFRGIASHLESHDHQIYRTSVSFAARLEQRSRDLRQQVLAVLQESGHQKVHLIGHSMGGLDARRMIVNEGMADKIASVTTIGTPHLGSTFANWGLEHGGDELIRSLSRVINLEGFKDLTTEACRGFNTDAEHAEASNQVIYQTYASTVERKNVFLPFLASWEIVRREEGENDGLVSIQSQQWTGKLVSQDGKSKTIRQYEVPFPADHINQTGWWHFNQTNTRSFWRFRLLHERRSYEQQVRELYLQIAEGLHQLGNET